MSKRYQTLQLLQKSRNEKYTIARRRQNWCVCNGRGSTVSRLWNNARRASPLSSAWASTTTDRWWFSTHQRTPYQRMSTTAPAQIDMMVSLNTNHPRHTISIDDNLAITCHYRSINNEILVSDETQQALHRYLICTASVAENWVHRLASIIAASLYPSANTVPVKCTHDRLRSSR